MGYHYDPILCMNVPDSTSKAKDAKALDDAKADFQKIISLTKQIDDITRRYGRKIDSTALFAYTEQIRNKVQYYIDNASRGWYDSAPAGVRDANKKEGFVIHSAQIKGNKIAVVIEDLLYSPGKKEIEEFTKEEASKIKNDPWTTWKGNSKSVLEKFISSRDSKTVDKAIRMADKFTVWESDEYDDIYVSYEGGTYVLYVENRPQADGSQQKMIQLAKQEERMRG